jgi:hypothetical protein
MTALTFENVSGLRKIGKRAFAKSRLSSIAIPASTQEIDGSGFLHCPLETISIATGNQKSIDEGDLLLTPNGTELVRYFRRGLKLIVLK